MANPTTVGYLITVDGVTIVDVTAPVTTPRAISVAQNVATANPLTYVIPSGVKIDYNATADGTTTPGQLSQDILCTSGGVALYGTLVAKLNNYVTSVLSPLSGADLTNTATRLIDVQDITPNRVKRTGAMHIRVTIDIIGDWA